MRNCKYFQPVYGRRIPLIVTAGRVHGAIHRRILSRSAPNFKICKEKTDYVVFDVTYWKDMNEIETENFKLESSCVDKTEPWQLLSVAPKAGLLHNKNNKRFKYKVRAICSGDLCDNATEKNGNFSLILAIIIGKYIFFQVGTP